MLILSAILAMESWALLALGLVLCAAVAFVLVRRRPDLPRLTSILIVAGALLMALAAGGLTWNRTERGNAVVMVDLSPSTRTAQYRDRSVLQRRISQLLGRTPFRVVCISSAMRDGLPQEPVLADMPAEKTVFHPASASAILLFSDCQFDLPRAAPPVYIAADPMLEDPPDAAVRKLEIRGTQIIATAINGTESQQQVTISPGSRAAATVGPGTSIIPITRPAGVDQIAASIAAQDPWPENNRLAIRVPLPETAQKWWVGGSAPRDFVRFSPGQVPEDPARYLAPAVIVLDNVAAGDLTDLQLQRLGQYVRDLGGALVILGGDRAFAAGAYAGTELESLSPLSSVPPAPMITWILLGDSSGSMAAIEGGASRWDRVKQAMLGLLARLPPRDLVTIGSFAESLRWWSTGKSARETSQLPLPPADVRANGPTNLEAALLRIIAESDASPKELLLLSDADAQITRMDELRSGLAQKKIRLNLLALREDGRALAQLEELVRATGGRSMRESVPEKWAQSMLRLYAQAAPDHLEAEPVTLAFSRLPQRTLSRWNRTWLKNNAQGLAQATVRGERVPLLARWNAGSGQVISAAFPANSAEAQTLAAMIAQPPRDPRYRITWDAGPELRVSIDAVDAGRLLNGLDLRLRISTAQPIPQTAPGRYELAVAAPREPVFAAVMLGNRVLDRIAVAGRYAHEFDSIGNNRINMRELASRSGGAIIPPTQAHAIDLRSPGRPVPVSSALAAIAAALIAIGLIYWKFH